MIDESSEVVRSRGWAREGENEREVSGRVWGRSTRVEREKLENQMLSVSSAKEPGLQGELVGSRLAVSFVPPELQVSDRLEITALPFVDGCHPVATILEFG